MRALRWSKLCENMLSQRFSWYNTPHSGPQLHGTQVQGSTSCKPTSFILQAATPPPAELSAMHQARLVKVQHDVSRGLITIASVAGAE